MSEVRLRKYLYISIIFMVVQFLAQIFILIKGAEYITTNITVDDTYYYLETAWNHHLLGYPTFDGINNTNGFHLIWYLILLGIAYIFTEKYMLLYGAIVVCALLNALSYIFFIKIGVRLKSTIFIVILSSIWFLANISPSSNISGMENSLHIFISCWVLYEIFYFLYAINLNKQVNLIRFTLSLIFNAYSRVDSGLFSSIVFIICILTLVNYCGGLREFFREYRRHLLFSALLIVTSIFILFSTYFSLGNTFIPISGIIKNSGIFGYEYPTLGKVLKVYKHGLPHLPLLFYIGPLLALVMIFFTVSKHKYYAQIGSIILLRTHLVYFIGVVFYSTFMWLCPTTAAFAYWYFSPVKVYWIFMIGSGIYLLISFFFKNNLKVPARITLFSVIFFSITIGSYSYFLSLDTDPESPTKKLYRVRYNVALWIARNIPNNIVLASWNAGQLGFFSNHSVINLDGLINNKKYYDRVLKGNYSLTNYLKENNVRYIVDYQDHTYDKFTNRLFVIYRSSPITARRMIKIWDLASLPDDVDIGFYPKKIDNYLSCSLVINTHS